MSIEEVIIAFVSGASGGGLLHLIIKTYLTQKIKAQINHEYNIKFENARKELEKKATEHQIQYSKLHIERSEKFKEIFSSLIQVEKSLDYLTSLAQGPEWASDTERENQAKGKLERLESLYFK